MVEDISPTSGGIKTIQAHRCFAGIAPENTRLAAQTAVKQFKATWLEIDVQPTSDGTVVCFHDEALHKKPGSRGITDTNGIVWKTPSKTVLSAEVLDSGQTVPSFADFLDAVPTEVGLTVELKNPGSDAIIPDRRLTADELIDQRALWDGFVDDIVATLDSGDRSITFSSFYEGAIAAAADRAPAIPRAVSIESDLAAGRSIADRHDADAINVRDSLLIEAGEPFVTDAHASNLTVNAWTGQSWTDYRDLDVIGVDGLIADYPFLDVVL